MIIKSLALIKNLFQEDIGFVKDKVGSIIKRSPYEINIKRKKKGNKNDSKVKPTKV